MSRLSKVTIQGDDAMQGDYRAGVEIATTKPKSYGVGIYAATAGNVELVTLRGSTVLYNGLAAGTAIPTCLFTGLGSNTTVDDITITLVTRPFH